MTQPLISLENVALTYGKGAARQVILDETNLRIDAGDFVALVGPSGCGKSTILKLITGIARATSGTMLVKGREIGVGGVKNLGHYAARRIAGWPKRPSSTAALT